MSAAIPPRVRFAPRVPSWHMSRYRIVDLIEQGLHDGLVIVRGAVGGGKTTAVAEWAKLTSREGTWVATRADAATRFAFWQNVLRALDAEYAPDGRSRLGVNTETHLRLALSEVFEGGAHVLILEDFHLVSEKEVEDDVAWLVTSTNCSVILNTRVALGLEAGAAAARLGPTVLGPDVLAFSREESRQILTRNVSLTADVVEAAYEHLAGWPLATRTLELELRRRGSGTDLRDAVKAVGALLAGEHPALPAALLEREALEFGVRVVVAESLTRELAVALAPESDVTTLLERFESDGLGAWTEGPTGAVFTLQTFVRSALMERSAALPRDQILALRRTYATWADHNGYPVIAGQQALALADWALLADLAQRHFRRIMLMHRSEWSAILAAVPFDRLRRYPVLGAVMIQLLNADSGASDRMRAISAVLINSIAPLRERGSTADRLWRNASALAAERILGRYGAASATADRIVALIDLLTPEEHGAVHGILPLLYVHVGTTRLYAGDTAGAIAQLEAALGTEVDTQWSHLHARSLLALIAALRGDLPAAAEQIASIDTEITIPNWRGTYTGAGYHLARAIQYLESFDTKSARSELSLLDRHFDTIEHWPLILHIRSLILLGEGSPTLAAARLPDQIKVRSRRSSTSVTMRELLASTQTELLLAAGEVVAAERVASHSDHSDSPIVAIAAARAALATSRDTVAVTLSNQIIGPAGASPRSLGSALLIRTIARQRTGRQEDALTSFRQSLDVLQRYGLRFPLAVVPRDPLINLVPHLDAATAATARALFETTPFLLQAKPTSVKLTNRERAVLRELTRSGSARVIADTLFVSPNTVKSQIRSLYRKLGVSTRDDALAVARETGLLPRE